MKPNPSSPLAFAALLAVVLAPAGATAQEEVLRLGGRLSGRAGGGGAAVASEGAEFLLIPIGARAVAMGGAVSGLRGSGESVLWSPAGLAGLKERRLLFNHSEAAFDTRSEVLSLLWPTQSHGTVGITYYLVDFGELSSTGVDGAVQGTINFRNQEFLLSYATRLIGPLEAGINYKLIQLVFRCDGRCPDQRSFTRTTHAVDLGLLYDHPVGLPISVGGAIRHLGFPLESVNEDDPLPTRVRVGVAYQALSSFMPDSVFALALAVDVEDQWRALGNPDVMVGSEFGVAERFFLRAGYAFVDSGLGGAALGFGLTYDWLYMDLSRGFDDISAATGEESVQVTFGVIF